MFNFRNINVGKIIASLFFCALLYVIVYKSVYVPITHDEKSATVYYPNFTVFEIMKYPGYWPSNHILNSIFIKYQEKAFGITPLSVRLHSILSFVFFFGVIGLIAQKYFSKNAILYSLPFVLMFCNPFLLDFFGLARGYGLSNALMAASVCSLLFYASFGHIRSYLLAIVFAMLAAYANFTLLIYWAAVHLLLAGILILKTENNKQAIKEKGIILTLTALLFLAFLALCYGPLYKMQSTNQFIYWSKESFFANTIVNQIDEFRYGSNWLGLSTTTVARIVVSTFIFSLVYSILKFSKGIKSAISDPLVILTGLLFTVYAINMAQAIILGTPYLTTRTALSYYVLFAFMLMFLLRDVSSFLANRQSGIVFSVLIVVLVLHLGFTVNLKSVREWWFDANTYRVQNYLRDYLKKHQDINTISLNTNWIFNPSFGFYCITGKTPWINLTELHTETDTASKTLFYYATDAELPYLKNYNPVAVFNESQSTLLLRKDAAN